MTVLPFIVLVTIRKLTKVIAAFLCLKTNSKNKRKLWQHRENSTRVLRIFPETLRKNYVPLLRSASVHYNWRWKLRHRFNLRYLGFYYCYHYQGMLLYVLQKIKSAFHSHFTREKFVIYLVLLETKNLYNNIRTVEILFQQDIKTKHVLKLIDYIGIF